MYCIKCGVELADSEKVCPLCGTRVYHPDLVQSDVPPAYPSDDSAEVKVNMRGVMFAVTLAFAALIVQLFICAFSFPGANIWAGFSIGGVLLIYIIVFLPMWFRHPNPIIFVPVDFAAVLVYVLYICLALHGNWFLSFAFPVIGAIALIVTAVVVLFRCLKHGRLYILGGALIANGLFIADQDLADIHVRFDARFLPAARRAAADRRGKRDDDRQKDDQRDRQDQPLLLLFVVHIISSACSYILQRLYHSTFLTVRKAERKLFTKILQV